MANPPAVQATVVLPGWFINRRGKSDVWVMNTSEIADQLRTEKERVTPKTASIIAQLLDDQCRDMDF